MKLVAIYTIVTALLECIYGKTIFFGTDKKEKPRALALTIVSISFCVATIGSTFFFLYKDSNLILFALCTVSYLVMTASMVAFMASGVNKKSCKIVNIAAITVSTVAIIYLSLNMMKPNNDLTMLLYYNEEIGAWTAKLGTASKTNFINLATHLFNTAMFTIAFIVRNKNESDLEKRHGNRNIAIIYYITLVIDTLFNNLLFDYKTLVVWLEPMLFWFCLISIFMTIIKYRTLLLLSAWQKRLTRTLIVFSYIALYFVFYSIGDTISERSGSESGVIIFVNIIIAIIFIALTPVVSVIVKNTTNKIIETSSDVNFISNEIVAYAKKHRISGLNSFFAYVAEIMEISYIGAIVDRRIYGSSPLSVQQSQIEEIMGLGQGEDGYWQECPDQLSKELKEIGIEKIASASSDGDVVIAQLVFGKSTSKNRSEDELEKRLDGIMTALSTSIRLIS